MSYETLVNGSGQTVTISRRSPSGTRDAYGRDDGTWTTFYTGPCYAEKMTGEENRSGRETQWDRLNVFLLAAADGVLDSDTVTISGDPGGTDLNIEQVREFRNPRTGALHHIELRTRTEK